jgi:hypothetical protein
VRVIRTNAIPKMIQRQFEKLVSTLVGPTAASSPCSHLVIMGERTLSNARSTNEPSSTPRIEPSPPMMRAQSVIIDRLKS